MAKAFASNVSFLASTSLSATNVAVTAATKTFTRSGGSFLTDNFVLGQNVNWTGFSASGNNVSGPITSLSSSQMVLGGATTLVDEASASGRNCYTYGGIRDWAGRLEALLTASGWIQTSDAGQTAASALVNATASGQLLGYQIWRMNDALQASAPLFIKIEFLSTGSITNPGMAFTIGTGSSGGGVITGVMVARTAPVNMGAGTAAFFIGSGDTNRLCFFLAGNTLSASLLFSIERTPDSAGADTSDGFLLLIHENSSSSAVYVVNQLIRPSLLHQATSTALGAFAPSGSNWALGGNIGVCPIRFFDGAPSNPCRNLLLYLDSDLVRRGTADVALYGTTRKYMAIGSDSISSVVANGSSSLLIRYE
ncbi:hypothetical protein [Geothrix sp. PMB-07]|uniref:hypothetical protein n=1 Tax=Geothrix sp. PMB-07 TaxID=3068640 RepID=UPI0027427DE4|nr:hypothetical protein [Geothrix sp. PMB-07]WLT30767.1 hypothetical protein Q9293_13685 [Geothrix sp. PMB-07]WLT32271.1 hypothetical protein Q9293_02850 [Geothrix sp. PMB-07]